MTTMTTKKKSYAARLGVLALALTLVTTCLLGTTLAKYTSEITGTGTAAVAKWAVALKADANATAASSKQTADFDFTLADTGDNKDNVANNKVAPGSTGSVAVEIDTTGTEVASTITITIAKGTGMDSVPVEFYSDAGYTDKITDSITQEITAGASGDSAKKTQVIYWKWVTKDDTTDTALGTTAGSGTFTIKLSAEQKIATT